MSITWKTYQENNARFEQACLEQAKQEFAGRALTGMEFIRKVLIRAQEIKQERKGEQ